MRGLKLPKSKREASTTVAPLVGAWIETMLKPFSFARFASHPLWVRGLKHAKIVPEHHSNVVAPLVGAWIETRGII